MNFIVSSSSLLKQIQTISGVLNSSNTLPILDNFLFDIKDNVLTITGSDLETTMSITLNVEANENGAIAIPAKLLLDTLKSFPDQPLTFSIEKDNFQIEIVSDYGKYSLTGHNADEFPTTPEIEQSVSLTLAADVLERAFNKTLFATGNDELRPVMSGVYCELAEDNITFVSTDAHKLVRYRRNDAKGNGSSTFILPKKPLNLLKSSLNGKIEEVTIEYNNANAFFQYENVKLTCRLIEGKYPNYEAVIPKNNPNKLTIDKNSLLGSIKRVSNFSNKTTHQVRLKISGSDLQILAEDPDFANKANERLTCQYEGTDMEIGFNSRFLIEMLNNMDTPEINLEMSAPNRAGIILPADGENADEDILMLVMPVMLNNN